MDKAESVFRYHTAMAFMRSIVSKGILDPEDLPAVSDTLAQSTVYHCAVYSSIRTCYVGKAEPICHDGRWALWIER